MKSPSNIAVVVIAVASLSVSIFALVKNPGREAGGPNPGEPARAPTALPDDGRNAALERRISVLESTLGRLNDPAGAPAEGSAPATASIDERLAGIESSLASLQSAFNGISLESASGERDELFRSEEGHLKADEYFAAEKYAIAGEGYLKFLEAHPDHPDAYDILGRAREAFSQAGYMDRAIWAQQELIKNRGEPTAQDLTTLASLEKLNGDYADAAEHIGQAADMLEGTDRMWKRLYWAWYTQLGEGNEAGLAAYRDVQEEIIAAGYSDHRTAETAAQRIAEIERLQAAQR